MSNLRDFFTCKRILIILVFTGFLLHHMLRINISIAIVDMIVKNRTQLTNVTRYDWNEGEKSTILGCFFWGYFIASVIAGHFSEVYGTRKVLGSGMVLGTLCTLATPHSTYINYHLLLAMRVGVGFALGIEWSSIMPLATKWIATTDISKFMSNLLACQLGAALTLTLCGYLINVFGWPSVFYSTGTVSMVWTIAWFYFVYDSPQTHPRISQAELAEIEEKVKYKTKKNSGPKPWLKIFSSRHVWAIIVANFAVMFSINFAANYTPLYMDQILRFDIRKNGFLSSLPCIGGYTAATIGSYLADRWRKNFTFPLLTIRRIFTTIALCVPMLFLGVQLFWGYISYVSLIVFIVWQTALGVATAGHIPNAVDISPTYSGTIHGVSTGAGALGGYFSTKVFAALMTNEQDFQQWRILFMIIMAVSFVGAMFYMAFASAEVQEWNDGFRQEEVESIDVKNNVEKEAIT